MRALATAAGMLVHRYDPDVDGVDLGLRIPGPVNGIGSPLVDVQVKSISTPRAREGEWYFGGLNEVQFNKLAGDDFSVPRFLFLICVPRRAEEYASITPDGMLLRRLAYFTSLEKQERIARPDTRRRRSVRVPIGNVLTVGSLRKLVSTAHLVPVGRAG